MNKVAMWIGITIVTCVGIIMTQSSDWAILFLVALALDYIFD